MASLIIAIKALLLKRRVLITIAQYHVSCMLDLTGLRFAFQRLYSNWLL